MLKVRIYIRPLEILTEQPFLKIFFPLMAVRILKFCKGNRTIYFNTLAIKIVREKSFTQSLKLRSDHKTITIIHIRSDREEIVWNSVPLQTAFKWKRFTKCWILLFYKGKMR